VTFTVQIRKELAAQGNHFDADVARRMRNLIAPLHSSEEPPATVSRDLAYGPHERHRLDVFHGATSEPPRPALIFVPGGGFVAGDKHAPPDQVFYDNVGAWALRHGLVGVTINYRLAPDYMWPSGAEDIGEAINWVCAHASELGIDPARLVVMGQSAGAAHVASYLAQCGGAKTRVCAAVLLSGIYDVPSAASNFPKRAYYGDNATLHESQSSVLGLCNCAVPFMLGINERDPPDFQRQALCLLKAYQDVHGTWPYFAHFKYDNHISGILRLNLRDDPLGAELEQFLGRHLP
jgi:acetyl esterase/lipase